MAPWLQYISIIFNVLWRNRESSNHNMPIVCFPNIKDIIKNTLFHISSIPEATFFSQIPENQTNPDVSVLHIQRIHFNNWRWNTISLHTPWVLNHRSAIMLKVTSFSAEVTRFKTVIPKTFTEVNKNKISSQFGLFHPSLISSFKSSFSHITLKKSALFYLNVFPKTNCLPHQCSQAPQPETISLEMDWPNSAVKRSMDHAKVPVDPAMPGKR